MSKDINIQVALDSIKLAQYNQTQWFAEMKHHQQTKDLHHTLIERYHRLQAKIGESRKIGMMIGVLLSLAFWGIMELLAYLIG